MFIRIDDDYMCSGHPEQADFDLAAKTIRELKKKDRTLSMILQYIIDSAADQYISENFHQHAPHLLYFFRKCGTDNEEVLFLGFVEQKKPYLKCRNSQCEDSQLVGSCPLMQCPDCGRTYFIEVGNLSNTMCQRCAAHDRECTEQRRRLAYRLFFIWEEE